MMNPRAPLYRDRLGPCLFFCLLLYSAGPVQAQPSAVSGFVSDAADGQALAYVNLVLRDPAGAVTGTVTNRDGLYLITNMRPGPYTLSASYVGYQTYQDTLELVPGRVLTLNIELQSDQAALDEIVVQAEREDGAARVTAGQQRVTPRDIERIPTPDVSGDLAAYLTTLPGVVSTGDQGGQLFIRGGEPAQNLVRLDGMTVYQPFHLIGFYSAFPSDIINTVDIYAGGFGSSFGERVSSVLDVWTRTGNKRTYSAAVAVSPFVSSVRVEGPIVKDKVSVLASARMSTIEHTSEPIINRRLPFQFGDFFAKVHTDVRRTGRLSVSALHTYDRGTVREAFGARAAEEVRWQNQAIGARYLFLPSVLPVATDFRLTYARLKSELGPQGMPSRVSSVQSVDASIEASTFNGRVRSRFGMEGRFVAVDNELGGLFQNVVDQNLSIGPFAVFAEPEYDLGWLQIRPGFRLQLHHSTTQPHAEPRIRLISTLGVHELSAAVGRYSQEIIGLNDRRDAASVFTAWTVVPRSSREPNDIRVARLLKSVHALGGYRVQPLTGVEFSLEGFYKRLSDLLIAEWTSFPRFTTELQPAKGRSYGFDARLELRRRGLYGYINYGYSNTLYDAEQETLQLWYGEEAYRFRPAHDRRHQLNVVLSTGIRNFDINVRWAFGSGLPFSQAIAFDGFASVADIVKMSEVPGSQRVIYGEPFGALLPTYHRLDLSVERAFHFRRSSLTVQGSLINVYDRANLFYLDVFTYQRVNQLPLFPSLGIKLEV